MSKDNRSFIEKTISLASALLFGSPISRERMTKRVEICGECEHVQRKGNLLRCGICGCPAKESGLINLARYEETESYGCKHPNGSKWKEAGV